MFFHASVEIAPVQAPVREPYVMTMQVAVNIALEPLFKQFRVQWNMAHHKFMMIKTPPYVIEILRIVLQLVDIVIPANKHFSAVQTL